MIIQYHFFSEEELTDDNSTKEEAKHLLIERLESRNDSLLLASDVPYTFYINAYDCMIEDVSGEKTKLDIDEFKILFKVTKTFKDGDL